MKKMLKLVVALSVVLMLAGVSFAGNGPIHVDIKPQSCPNPFNFGSKGVLPVAILGTTVFDVTVIDPASILLAGVSPLRWSYEDVASAYDDFNVVPDCPCSEAGPDGYLDLTLKFDAQAVAVAIGDERVSGELIRLSLIGVVPDGTIVGGSDCVVVVGSQRDGVPGIELTIDKVTICHIPPGNPSNAKTLSIEAESVADHLAHGDFLGSCEF